VSRCRDNLDFGHHQAVAEHLRSFAFGPQPDFGASRSFLSRQAAAVETARRVSDLLNRNSRLTVEAAPV